MRIQRCLEESGSRGGVLRVETADGWADLDEAPTDLRWLERLGPPEDAPASNLAAGLLPVFPRSFRDCLLYERHWIDASRGYVRRFMPAAYPFTRVYEWIAQRPFPAFRPPALFAKRPIYYFGNHLTIVPSGTPILSPSYTRALDYELELGWVLSKPLFNASPHEALDAIGGFVVVNDFSARDVQRIEMQSGLGPQKSKHFLTSMSRTIVTAGEILPRVDDLSARVEINGEVVARTSTAGMRFGIADVLVHLSRDEQLLPGELIATGTLPGGSGMENGRWIQPGDTLRLVIDAVGEIAHEIR